MINSFIKPALLVSVLVGTIVGVGIFAVPYTIMKLGPAWGFFLLVGLGLASLLVHTFYGEVALSCEGKKRFVGYTEKYLGQGAKKLATLSLSFGFLGSILAYLVVGGDFMEVILGTFSLGGFVIDSFVYSLLFWALGALFVYVGIKTISSLELGMSLFLVAVVFLFFATSLGQISLGNFSGFNFDYTFIAYGVFLTAFAGYAAIPEIRELASGTKWVRPSNFKKIIVIGAVISLVVYIIFAFSVVGVAGRSTSSEAMQSLVSVFGEEIVMVGAIFGVLACFTSYMVLGVNLKKMFWSDWSLGKNLSWSLVVFLPLGGFLLGLRDFIPIISLVGAIMGGINGILIILMHDKVSSVRTILKRGLLGLFLVGLILRIFKLF